MIKNAHSNSILFKDAAYKMAQKVGLSDGRTVKKYLAKCIEMGLCEECVQPNGKRTVYKFISYSKALTRLLGFKKSQLKYFHRHQKLGKFKNYQYQIELDLVSLNMAQQAYKINSNFPNKNNIIKEINDLSRLSVSEKQTRAVRNRRSKLLRRYTNADQIIQESQAKGHCRDVVTGCRHIGNLIGKSSTSGNKRIKKWIDTGNISVKDAFRFKPTDSEQGCSTSRNLQKRESKRYSLIS